MNNPSIEKYLNEMQANPEEREATLRWVSEGNDLESNPFFMCNEDGTSMDCLSALRIANEQKLEHLS